MTYLYVFNFCPFGRALSDTRRTPSSHAAALISRCGLSGIECRPVQRVQCPGVCAGSQPVVGGLPCIWYALCCSLCFVVRPGALACPAVLGLGAAPTSGVYGESRGVGWSVSRISKPIKRRSLSTPTPSSQNETPVIVQVSKNSEKYKKAPLPV